MAAAWRCCAATEGVAPCDGHESDDRREHGGMLRLFRVSPAEKKLGVCRRGRRRCPGHAGPAVLITLERDVGTSWGVWSVATIKEGEDLVQQQAGRVDRVGARQVRELGHADHGGVGALTRHHASWARPCHRECELERL